MNRNHIIVLILFATFSVVNSLPQQLVKRNDWGTCFTSEGAFPRLNVATSSGSIVEGQQETFTVSGPPLPNDINEDDRFYIWFVDDDDENKQFPISETPVCGTNGLPQCPIKAGTDFTVYMNVMVPTFPDAFDVYAVIGLRPDRTLGCAYTVEWPNPPKFV
ncbi:13478_t:CDS:1 [Dentiscutata erythropus]|uniref:13478_t:CDS:1 n=1 Tax=Dentiscutata erythropus TaxID=1348616 RepID=A0A9N9A4X0_9GLOM|nr:13478_t:CDS:1 [Dentiscutata erythropus]